MAGSYLLYNELHYNGLMTYLGLLLSDKLQNRMLSQLASLQLG